VSNKNAPDAVQGVEGESDSTSKEEQDMNIIADTPEIRTAIRDWAVAYADHLRHDGPDAQPPAWPTIATPIWANRVDIPAEIGSEVDVCFARDYELAGISALLTVVVSDAPEFERNHPGAKVGDVLIGDDAPAGPTIAIFADTQELTVARAAAVFDSLAEAITTLRLIEAVG